MPEPSQSLADLQAEYQEKITKALGNAKTKLKTELELAAMTFESIVKAGEAGIWQSPTIAPILASLGLQPTGGTEVGNGRKGKKRGRKPGVKAMGREVGNGKMTMKEAVLKVLGKKPTSIPDIVEAVSKIKKGVKKASVSQAINQLKKSKEIKPAARGEYVKA